MNLKVLVRRICRCLRFPLRSVIWAAYAHHSPQCVVEGIRLVDMTVGSHDATPLARLTQAIEQIGSVRPRSLDQIRRYIASVAIVFDGGPGYVPFANVCVFDVRHLQEQSTTQIAAELVHEAVHARIAHAGIKFTDANARRIEHACVRAQIDFLRFVPDAEYLVEGYERILQSQNEWWSRKAQLSRQLDGMEAAGIPPWVRKLVRRRFNGSSERQEHR